uniref:FERM domain-containing protein n=1 Tax=Macrostomum lignano TaxID=282301 RepID=A0A1I8F3F2_9PLAT
MSESRKTPPTSPRRGGGGSGGGKTLTVKVVMLDDTVNSFQVPDLDLTIQDLDLILQDLDLMIQDLDLTIQDLDLTIQDLDLMIQDLDLMISNLDLSRVAGQELFNAVVKKLKLLEIDYFDLEFLSKEGRQFYPPDPHLLEDEYTRFLFALQIKRDLVNGLLPAAENTMALLASYLCAG